jgi:hypothetical protein
LSTQGGPWRLPPGPRLAATAAALAIIAAAPWTGIRFQGLEEEMTRLAATAASPTPHPSSSVSPGPQTLLSPSGKPTPSISPQSSPTPTRTQASPTPTPTPRPRLLVTVDSKGGIYVLPDDITVAYGTLVEIANPTSKTCDVGPKADLPQLVGGDSTLEPGTSLTLKAPDRNSDLKLTCLNAPNYNVFYIRSRAAA